MKILCKYDFRMVRKQRSFMRFRSRWMKLLLMNWFVSVQILEKFTLIKTHHACIACNICGPCLTFVNIFLNLVFRTANLQISLIQMQARNVSKSLMIRSVLFPMHNCERKKKLLCSTYRLAVHFRKFNQILASGQ